MNKSAIWPILKVTLFVLLIVAAFMVGVFLGEVRGKNLVDNSAHVETVLVGAFHKNHFARSTQRLRDGEMTQNEYDEFVTRSLLDNIVYLCLNEELATDTENIISDRIRTRTAQPDRSLMQTGHSMELLGLNDSSELNKLFQADRRKIDWYDESLFDENGQITESFADFVDRSVERFQSIKNPGK